MSRKHVRTGAVLAALIGVFLAGMSASQADDPTPSPPRSAQLAAVDVGPEMLYRPITPCRAVDTRVAGGAFAGGGVTRTESMVTGLSAQGGNNANCGVPATAQAVTASVTVVGTGGAGDLKIYPANVGIPNASAMAWSSAGLTTTTGVNVTLYSGNVKITANGAATHVVVDITGYYLQQMFVHVNDDGTTRYKSNRVVSSARETGFPVGRYSIHFDRDVSSCSAVATAFSESAMMDTSQSGDVVNVIAHTPSGLDYIDTEFQLTVTC